MKNTFKDTEPFDGVNETGMKSSGPPHPRSSHAFPSLKSRAIRPREQNMHEELW